jgi:hypothetical protein
MCQNAHWWSMKATDAPITPAFLLHVHASWIRVRSLIPCKLSCWNASRLPTVVRKSLKRAAVPSLCVSLARTVNPAFPLATRRSSRKAGVVTTVYGSPSSVSHLVTIGPLTEERTPRLTPAPSWASPRRSHPHASPCRDARPVLCCSS